VIAVFLAILLISRETLLKLDGVGTASAILVDATVVRMVLVPEVMQRIRRGNGAPRWRDRTCQPLHVETPAAPRRPRRGVSVAPRCAFLCCARARRRRRWYSDECGAERTARPGVPGAPTRLTDAEHPATPSPRRRPCVP
jgi:hypothetical protein